MKQPARNRNRTARIPVLPVLVFALVLATSCFQRATTATANNKNIDDDDSSNALCPSVCRCQNQNGDSNLYTPTIDCSRVHLRKPPVTPVSTLTLDLSGNSLGPILNASLSRMRNLTDLDLSHNGIRRLLGCTLNGMLSLRRISLRGNRLQDLPESLFADARTVQHMDLSGNLMAVLPDQVFRNTPNLKTLDLSHNGALTLRLGLRFQVPRHLEFLDLSHNQFQSVDNDSFHMAAQWEPGVKRTLNLAHCRLSAIHQGSLANVPDLNALDVSGNPEVPAENLTAAIKALERGRLERLEIAGMNLTDINAFFTQVTLLSLKFLNVSDNRITDLPSGIFSTIKSLRVLDISRNKLTSLGAGVRDLINLEALNLSSNALTSFKGTAVDKLAKVEDLDVSHNRLSRVSNFKLRPLIKLRRLVANDNLLPSVVLPRTTNNLVHIDYSANSIRSFGGFHSVPKLESFDISDNDLEKVGEFLFKDSHIMKSANFSGNSVTQLDPRAFLPQSPLVIDLSHNFLTAVQYSNWVATQELFLNANRIERVDMQTYHLMTGLRVLDMSGNNITDLHEDLLSHTTALEYLNLSGNALRQSHFSLLLRNLRELRTLDLGGNNISHLNESMLEPLPKLERLSVRANNLEVVMPRVFRDLAHIKLIDLSHNPFSCVCDLLALRDWLSRTSVPIVGLYSLNSSAYTCRGPASRVGEHVMRWEPGRFECDEVMLYMIVFGSIAMTLIVAGVFSTVVHRLYLRHKRKKEKQHQYQQPNGALALEKVKRQAGKKGRLTSEEIAEDFTNAIEKMERRSMRKAEESKRRANGYVPWPAGKREKEKEMGKGKEERWAPENGTHVPPTRDEAVQLRSAQRYYDHLTRTDGGRMEFEAVRADRDRDQAERWRDGRADEGRRETRRGDRGSEYIGIHGGVARHRSDNKPAHGHPTSSWRHPDRGHYSDDQERVRRAEPGQRPSGSHQPSAFDPRAPKPVPRSRWDNVDVWDRDARGWVIPGHRRSRSQGHRRERDDQRYLTMPVREQDYHHRSRSDGRGGRDRGDRVRGADHYTNEVRFGVEDLDRYAPAHRTSRRDLYESRSKSYHQLPSGYRTAGEDGRESPRRRRDPRDQGRGERHAWPGERRPEQGLRAAASQPFLATEGASDWL